MSKVFKYRLKPEIGLDPEAFSQFMNGKSTANWKLLKRSIDARAKKVWVNVEVGIYDDSDPWQIEYQKPATDVQNTNQIIIVGAGPGGLFAALRCIELGIKPVILERGKDVRERRRDLAAINKDHIVNPDSNYCFGEGGAGTYSDGKLYTRSKKRGDVRRVLEMLVAHGASEEILVDTHPHIGTNKLPKVIADIRDTIRACGGEIHFDTRVTELDIHNGEVKGVLDQDGNRFEGLGVILATGHSARDIFRLLHQNAVKIESKDFALGVRVEHPQQLIDQIQYHCDTRGDFLPAAAYSLTAQTIYHNIKRGVFSFCMCPGGFIVPAATSPGELVVNGMSPSRRDSKFANSGIVVSVQQSDIKENSVPNEFRALDYQSKIEQAACAVAGGSQVAPAQRLADFVNDKLSDSLPDCSYQPGLASRRFSEFLPHDIYKRIKLGFKDFGKKSKGYMTNDAVVVGVESRTSSPIHIPRNRETMEHIEVKRLFPCGEGAGYAGGIMSAAIDGMNCAEAAIRLYNKKL